MAAINGLDSYFTSLISDLMAVERQPVTRLTQQKDTLTIQKAMYSDLKTKLDGLQSAIKALLSGEASYSLSTGRKVAVSGATSPTSTSNATVITASASSSALAGTYNLEVTQLAQAHRVRSDAKASTDQPLNLTGSFVTGGAANRAAAHQNPIVNDTVASFGTAEPAAGQRELGSGMYFVETRKDPADSAKWQFRLVNSEGAAASIRQADGTYSGSWQAFPESGAAYTHDTGRGMTIAFAAPGSYQARDRLNTNAAAVQYTAKGATVTVQESHSLNDIAAEINKAAYAEGNEIKASIIDRRLVIQSALSGSAHTILASDSDANKVLETLGVLTDTGAFKNSHPQLDLAQDAVFSINGISITRSRNTEITDAVGGMTLNLAADAKDGKAALTVTADSAPARTAISTFLTRFNDLQTYLKGKIATTKNADDTYTRGALSGDSTFRTLSIDLYSRFNAKLTNQGIYTNLAEIGLALDDNLQATIKDSGKLEAALKDNFSSVQKLMDAVMAPLNTRLSAYTGDKGYVSQLTKSNENLTKDVNSRIDELNKRLNRRQEQLTQQYAGIQAQLLQMTYTQQMWSSFYGSTNNMY